MKNYFKEASEALAALIFGYSDGEKPSVLAQTLAHILIFLLTMGVLYLVVNRLR